MKKQKKRKLKIHIFWYIWICVLTFVVLSAITQSRYISGGQGDATADVAKPIVTISATTLSDINNTVKDFAFTVQNYDLNNPSAISEVTMSYYLNIVKNTGLSASYNLYKIVDGDRVQVSVANGLTEGYVLYYTAASQDSYILELTFAAPPSNADIQDAVTINLNSEQGANATYALAEYIEFTGPQHIDSNTDQLGDIAIWADYQIDEDPGDGYQFVFGVQGDNYWNDRIAFYRYSSTDGTTSMQLHMAATYGDSSISSNWTLMYRDLGMWDSNRHEVYMHKGQEIKFDGKDYAPLNPELEPSIAKNIWIGGLNGGVSRFSW